MAIEEEISCLQVALDYFESRNYSGRFLHEDCCFFSVTPFLLIPVDYFIVLYPATLKTAEWKQRCIVFILKEMFESQNYLVEMT